MWLEYGFEDFLEAGEEVNCVGERIIICDNIFKKIVRRCPVEEVLGY
jgi:hypothetical protein